MNHRSLTLLGLLCLSSCCTPVSIKPDPPAHDFWIGEGDSSWVDCLSMWSYPDRVLRWELGRKRSGPMEAIGALEYGRIPRNMDQLYPEHSAPPEPLSDGQMLVIEMTPLPLMFSGCGAIRVFWFVKQGDHFETMKAGTYGLPRWLTPRERAQELEEVEEEIRSGRSVFLKTAASPTASPDEKRLIEALLEWTGQRDPVQAYRELRTRHDLYVRPDDIAYSNYNVRRRYDFDLRLYGCGPLSLTPLNDFRNLRSISIRNCGIRDLSPLSGLTRLRDVDLSMNEISNLDPMSGLQSLESLELNANRLSNLGTIAHFPNLTTLSARNNTISNLQPLAELAKLRSLDLDRNAIVDLSPLRNLKNLWFLYLGENRISDLTPLSGLGDQLHHLDLRKNQIVDISPLEPLRDLITLDLSDNQIKDATPIHRIAYPRLGGNPIEKGGR